MTRANPFARAGESAQKTGGRWEKFWSKLLGVEPQRGSGNQWTARMDVGDGSVLWNLKHSSKDTIKFGPYSMAGLMRECEQAINGPGGVGGSTIPGVAISEDGSTYVVFRAEDFIRMAQTGDYQYVTPSKGQQKHARSKIPALLRDDAGEEA